MKALTHALFIGSLLIGAPAQAGVAKLTASLPEIVQFIKGGKSALASETVEIWSRNGSVRKESLIMVSKTRTKGPIFVSAAVKKFKSLDHLVISISQKADPKEIPASLNVLNELQITNGRQVSLQTFLERTDVFKYGETASDVLVSYHMGLVPAGVDISKVSLKGDFAALVNHPFHTSVLATNAFGRSVVSELHIALAKDATPEQIETIVQVVKQTFSY